jgi:hypothetical protein
MRHWLAESKPLSAKAIGEVSSRISTQQQQQQQTQTPKTSATATNTNTNTNTSNNNSKNTRVFLYTVIQNTIRRQLSALYKPSSGLLF